MQDYSTTSYPGQLMEPLPMRPQPKPKRRPPQPYKVRRVAVPSRSVRSGGFNPNQPRDRDGKWVDWYRYFTRPNVAGPHKLKRLPVKTVKKTKKQRSRFVYLLWAVFHPKKWRVKQLRKRAKRNTKVFLGR